MDKIFFRRFMLTASVGILPQEKKQKQTIQLDLEFAIDAKKVAISDSIADTINYAEVRESIINLVALKHYDLLETLAETLAQHLVATFKMSDLKLDISKTDIFSDVEAVGVSVRR